MENDNQFFITREETETWLIAIGIKKYTINDDLTVDVDGDVWINNMNLGYIPVQFGIVTGYFSCSKNKLTSLKGCPEIVKGYLYCNNNQITNFDGISKSIGTIFYCYNNPITDFNHFEFEVGESIVFTPTEDMKYLDNYKDNQGDIRIEFSEFKRLQALKNLEIKLNDNLSNNLSIQSVKIKHKI